MVSLKISSCSTFTNVEPQFWTAVTSPPYRRHITVQKESIKNMFHFSNMSHTILNWSLLHATVSNSVVSSHFHFSRLPDHFHGCQIQRSIFPLSPDGWTLSRCINQRPVSFQLSFEMHSSLFTHCMALSTRTDEHLLNTLIQALMKLSLSIPEGASWIRRPLRIILFLMYSERVMARHLLRILCSSSRAARESVVLLKDIANIIWRNLNIYVISIFSVLSK